MQDGERGDGWVTLAGATGLLGRPVHRAPAPFRRTRRSSLVVAPKTPRAGSHTVGRPRPTAGGSVVITQGRLVDAIADGAVLCGSTDELAWRLAVRAAALRAALEELAVARWIVAETRPDGRLTVRWERRQHRVPVPLERRRAAHQNERVGAMTRHRSGGGG